MRLIENIINAELNRMLTRGNGYTTKQRELAHSLGYKFIVHDKALANDGDILMGQDVRGTQDCFVFDHHVIFLACLEADSEIRKLKQENEMLKRELK